MTEKEVVSLLMNNVIVPNEIAQNWLDRRTQPYNDADNQMAEYIRQHL